MAAQYDAQGVRVWGGVCVWRVRARVSMRVCVCGRGGGAARGPTNSTGKKWPWHPTCITSRTTPTESKKLVRPAQSSASAMTTATLVTSAWTVGGGVGGEVKVGVGDWECEERTPTNSSPKCNALDAPGCAVQPQGKQCMRVVPGAPTMVAQDVRRAWEGNWRMSCSPCLPR